MTTGLWPAPRAIAAVDATVELPASKSATARALVLAALADGPSRIYGPLRARDSQLMADAVRALGASVEDDEPGGRDWLVTPAPSLSGGGTVDCGLSGTVLRFIPPAAALADGAVRFTGDAYASGRPVGSLLAAIRALGVAVDGDRLPFTIRGTGHVVGGPMTVDASSSSQFVSGLLLAAARFEHGLRLRHTGAQLPSRPYITMTITMLRERGVQVDAPPDAPTWQVAPGPIAARDATIEPDLANSAPFLAAALVTGGRIAIPAWPARSDQPAAILPELCTRLGARVITGSGGLEIRGPGTIPGFDVDLRDASELLPVLATVATLATGPSRIRGVAHARGHESDRLAALARELTGLGADVRETPDGLTIVPAALHGGIVHTYDDHRLVTAAAVLGLVVDHIEVENLGAMTKAMPDFATRWRRMLAGAPVGAP